MLILFIEIESPIKSTDKSNLNIFLECWENHYQLIFYVENAINDIERKKKFCDWFEIFFEIETETNKNLFESKQHKKKKRNMWKRKHQHNYVFVMYMRVVVMFIKHLDIVFNLKKMEIVMKTKNLVLSKISIVI